MGESRTDEMSSRRAVVIVPAFNERATVGEVVGAIVRSGFPVVVVDDGSEDDTAALARVAGAVVLDFAGR